MKYTTEYQPEISETCKTYIGNNINPVFSNDSTSIYGLDYVIESLEEEINHAQEEVFGITKADINALNTLRKQDVTYIEL